MRALPIILSATLVAPAALQAQSLQAVLPTPAPAIWQTNNFPLAGPSGLRYQQVFAASQLQLAVKHPVRVTGLDFIAGAGAGQPGSQLDLEVTMANGPSVPSSFMDDNLQSGVVVVVPRNTFTLGPATLGTYPLQLNFKQYGTEFTWDGQSSVVVEVKLFNNGKPNNQAFTYSLAFSNNFGGQMWRLWGIASDPRSVTNASLYFGGEGVAMRLTWEEGVTVSYGSGCAGAGNVVPVASTLGGNPIPGNFQWTHVLSNANTGVSAVLLFGGSRTIFNGTPLPYNLGVIGAPNCTLLTSIVVTIGSTTLGGGPGTGTTSVLTPVPPISLYNQSAYTQWVVLDPLSANGKLATSQGQWHIFP